MTEKENKEKKDLEGKICKYLSRLTFPELAELKINGQHASRIKRGEVVSFYAKTIERLRHFVEK